MKRAAASLVFLLAIGLIGAGAQAVAIGFGVGYETSGLILVSALAETLINRSIDLRAQVGFAASGIAGLMLVTMDLLGHWSIPLLDPYIGLGIGAALTPPPFSTGVIAEGIAGMRVPAPNVVQLFLQVRYLVRWSSVGWNAGPVFEGGFLARF